MNLAIFRGFAPTATPTTVAFRRADPRRHNALTVIGLAVLSLSCSRLLGQTPTTTTLTVESATTGSSLQPVTLKVAVFTNSYNVSSGIVTFCDASARFCEDTAVVGTASLTADGTVSFKALFPPGAHTVYALFNKTQADAGSKSQLVSFEVGPKVPTTTFLGKPTAGDPSSIQATVTSAAVPPITGSVLLVDDAASRSVSAEVTQSKLTSSFAPLASNISIPIPFGYLGFETANFVATGDFNGDGFMDVAVAYEYGSGETGAGAIALFINDPIHPGQFHPGTVLSDCGLNYNLIAGDFNHDGLTDIAAECLDLFGTFTGEAVYLNKPASPGQFFFTQFSTPATYQAAADMNQDGILDLVGGGGVGETLSSNVAIRFGDPAHPGHFINETQVFDVGTGVLAVADFNGDGLPDVVVQDSNFSGNGLSVFLNDPLHPGKLLPAIQAHEIANNSTQQLVTGDFNHDGLPDVATLLYNGDVNVLLNRPDAPGHFAEPKTYTLGSYPFGITAGNFTGKYSLDLAVTDFTNGSPILYILPADPAHPGAFLSPVSHPEVSSSQLFAADFNGDGLGDVGAITGTSDPNSFSVSTLLSQPVETATVNFSGLSSQQVQSASTYADYLGDSNNAASFSCPVDLLTGAPATPVINGLGTSHVHDKYADVIWSGSATGAKLSYGTTMALGSTASLVQASVGPQATQEILLTGLEPATKYYFQLTSTLATAGCPNASSTSPVLVFHTEPSPQ